MSNKYINNHDRQYIKAIMERMNLFDKNKHNNPEYKKFTTGNSTIKDVMDYSRAERQKEDLPLIYLNDIFYGVKRYWYNLRGKKHLLGLPIAFPKQTVKKGKYTDDFKIIKYKDSGFKVFTKPVNFWHNLKNILHKKWCDINQISYVQFDKTNKDFKTMINYKSKTSR